MQPHARKELKQGSIKSDFVLSEKRERKRERERGRGETEAERETGVKPIHTYSRKFERWSRERMRPREEEECGRAEAPVKVRGRIERVGVKMSGRYSHR